MTVFVAITIVMAEQATWVAQTPLEVGAKVEVGATVVEGVIAVVGRSAVGATGVSKVLVEVEAGKEGIVNKSPQSCCAQDLLDVEVEVEVTVGRSMKVVGVGGGGVDEVVVAAR